MAHFGAAETHQDQLANWIGDLVHLVSPPQASGFTVATRPDRTLEVKDEVSQAVKLETRETAAASIPTMAHHQLPEYDDQCDWKAYITKAEAYFEATGVSDSAKKRAVLVAALSTRTVQVLAGQVAPRKPNSLTYEEAVKVLDDYFDPKRHEITESFRFFNRCQLEGSSRTPAMDAVLSEFQDVFSTELGLIDGHPVHLKLKEGATPKFYHQPLLGLLKADRPTPALAAARIQRWALYLGGFRYQLQYCPGPANEPDDWQLSSPEADVYARNFGTGEKWTPGIVQSKIGSRMVAIRTPAGSVRRHVDQVRKRENSPPPLGTDQEAVNQASRTGTPSDYPQSPRPSAEQGGIPEPEHEIQPELAASNAATDEPDSPPQALRRSTRQRKPVQRLQY
ncbi:uncharacterized protein LOC119462442 [Dermacentor silvarum]|uniref:uncharacterized protein LOC119462442 n=1 Tax=Dermacentor silvarum TaxID=543639 RepID=UPI002100C0F6|nr:uncharacterized protein LOC119462442 [Dermacentor silvarum]